MPESPPEYRFFLDYDEETESVNVFAAVTNYGLYGQDESHWTSESPEDPALDYDEEGIEGFGATFFRDNSGVSWCGGSRDALGPEIPEPVARKLHPRLFERIEKA